MAFAEAGAVKRDVTLGLKVDKARFQTELRSVEMAFKRLDQTINRWAMRTAVFAAGAAVAFGGLMKSVIGVASEVEQMRVQLNVMYGSAELGAKKLAWAMEAATQTPFQLPEIIKATVQLRAFGLEAERWLTTIGDLASGMSVPLEQVTMIFGRIKSGQFGEAMEQLRRMGISAPALIAEGIKFTGGGQIVSSIDEVLLGVERVVNSRFKGLMAEQMTTMAGTISNLQDWWYRIRLMVSEQVFKVFKADLRDILGKIDEWARNGKLQEWASSVAEKLREVYEWIKNVGVDLLNVVRDVWSALQPFAKFFGENAENIVKTLLALKALSVAGRLGGAALGVATSASGALAAGGAGGVASAMLGGVSLAGLATVAAAVLGTAVVVAAVADVYGKVSGAIARAESLKAVTGTPLAAAAYHGGFFEKYGRMPGLIEQVQLMHGKMPIPRGPIMESFTSSGIPAISLMESSLFSGQPRKVGYRGAGLFGSTANRAQPGVMGLTEKERDDAFANYERSYNRIMELSYAYSEDQKDFDRLRYRDLQELHIDAIKTGLTDEEDYRMAQLAINKKYDQLEREEKYKAGTVQSHMMGKFYEASYKSTRLFVEGQLSLQRSFALIANSIVLGGITDFLVAQGQKHAVAAAAEAFAGNFALAAGHAKAALEYGVGAGIMSAAQARLEREITGENTGNQSLGADTIGTTSGSSTDSRTKYGTTIQGQTQNITIAPFIQIQGDTIMIGDHTVEELADSLGDAAVMAVKDAIDNGEIAVR